MTLIEVLMVLAALMLLAAIFLPTLARPRHSHRINCINVLKQVTVGFRVWAGDYGERYPMQVSVTNGGSMELAGGTNAWFTFLVMSNELFTPKILICPRESDRARTIATTFQNPSPTTNQISFASNTNLSYFVGVDAVDVMPQTFLMGDHNLTNSVGPRGGILELTSSPLAGWTSGNHVMQGNIALADCSVQTFNTPSLRLAIPSTGVATNRLSMP